MLDRIPIDFEKQITSCGHLSPEDKTVFSELFSTLAKEQEQFFDDLLQRTSKEVYSDGTPQSTFFNIVTCVSKAEDAQKRKNQNFFPMKWQTEAFFPVKEHMTKEELRQKDENEPAYCGIGFLNCSYEKQEDFFHRTFTGEYRDKEGKCAEISYTLVKSYDYLEEEELLFQTVSQEGGTFPPIYSPMARRTVQVLLTQVDGFSAMESVDFKWKENGLEEILLTDSLLYWNISVTESDQHPKMTENTNEKVIPLFDSIYKIYQVTAQEDELIYFPHKNTCIKREHHRIYVGLEDDYCLEYKKLKIHKVHLEEDISYFENLWKPKMVQKQRVHALGDVAFLVDQCVGEKLDFLGASLQKGEMSILAPYQKIDAYRYKTPSFPRKVTPLYLKCKKREDDIYFLDKLAYLLDYLNHCFPEFRYIGGVV